jgi:tRNA-specific 2-thiouridylase
MNNNEQKDIVATEKLQDKRIALLLSGGVDSAVALHELVSLGLHPDCFYIKIGGDEKNGEEWDCQMEEDLEMATAVARRYGCSIEVVDCHDDYWNRVARYTMEKVSHGMTPNPDVMCNRWIKFGAFDEKRGHDYDIIATGHYAQTEWEENTKWLCTAPDPVKDQTDFLAQIDGWQLKKALFPIGHYMKEEVRAIAEREHLPCAHRKDSQGICFLGKIDYNEYLRRYLGERLGDIIDIETGHTIGQHRGHWFHTIGQRKGLGLGGGPWFVVRKDVERNIVFVSHGYDPETAYKQEFAISHFHSLNGVMPPHEVCIKIRHTPEFHQATLTPTDVLSPTGGTDFVVRAERPIHGVAPGQFCVVYDAKRHRCYGSGEISM